LLRDVFASGPPGGKIITGDDAKVKAAALGKRPCMKK